MFELNVEIEMVEWDLVNLQKYERIVLKSMIINCPLYPSRAAQTTVGLVCRERNIG